MDRYFLPYTSIKLMKVILKIDRIIAYMYQPKLTLKLLGDN